MKYDLVFEGGGAKGMVFVGACQEFFARGHSFDRLLGTSAGAITATLLAAGYSPKEMLEALLEKGSDGRSVFAGFMGPPEPFGDEELRTSATRRLLDGVDFTFVPDAIQRKLHESLLKSLSENETFRHVLAFIERGGWFAADRFVSWFSSKLDSGQWKNRRRSFSAMTLAQFFEATRVEVSMVASDTTEGKILVLNHRTAPDCPVVWATRMSMSIPLVWNEVLWQVTWGKYIGREIEGHAIVDGGLLSNFPIELFISDAPQIIKLIGPKEDRHVLGMLIDERLAVAAPGVKGIFVNVNIKPGELATVQRLKRLVDTATTAHDKMVMDEYANMVVHLPAAGYGTTEFDMSDERRVALVEAGRTAMAAYLNQEAIPTSAVKGIRLSRTAGTESRANRIAAGLLGLEQEADRSPTAVTG
jgi:predicted acylesterase/phospholipase RssA